MATDLPKTLGVVRGTAIMMNIVIGAGLLTLPGLAVKAAGDQALTSWLICALAAVPLLLVFIVLGRRFPDAGGVSAYARRGFGAPGSRIASVLFFGAVIFGLPSIALTGGHYLAAVFGCSPHAAAIVLVLGAVVPHLLPGEGAAKAMAWIASAVLAVVVLFLMVGWAGLDTNSLSVLDHAAIQFDGRRALVPFTMLFFAFTGWEVAAGMAEEFRVPRRDYPLAMMLSFACATVLYLAIAFVVARTDLRGDFEAPFVAIVRPILGGHGATAVAATAALIVFGNLSGAVWGVSRLIFGLARDGALPRRLRRLDQGRRPMAAVLATVSTLCLVVLADGAGFLGLDRMLGLAGQNFLLLYAIAAGALVVLAKSLFERVLGAAVILMVAALLYSQGLALLYPLGLVIFAVASEAAAHILHAVTSRRFRPV